MAVSLGSSLLQSLLQAEQTSAINNSVKNSDQTSKSASSFADLLAMTLLNGTGQQTADPVLSADTGLGSSDASADSTGLSDSLTSSPVSSSDLLWQLLASSLNDTTAGAAVGTASAVSGQNTAQSSQPNTASIL